MTSLLLVSECTIFGMGFEALVADDSTFRFLGSVHPAECVEQLERTTPDVVVVDHSMDAGAAMKVCEAISQRRPRVPILVLSNTLNDDAVRESIESGARGYLYKGADRAYLRSAIYWLAEGQAVLDPRVTRRVIDWATHSALDAGEEGLSGREIEVLRLVCRGEPNKRIAKRMGLTENTVKTYLRRAYRKLDCHTRSAAAAVLAQRGLL
jgi:DNA-binding NarL/FixJ family response regulator